MTLVMVFFLSAPGFWNPDMPIQFFSGSLRGVVTCAGLAGFYDKRMRARINPFSLTRKDHSEAI
jgi:hypothetical protein